MSKNHIVSDTFLMQPSSNLLRQQRVLKYVTDIDSSLRLQINVIALLHRVTTAVCEALDFRYSALYIVQEDGNLHAQAAYGISSEEESYLYQHPLPNDVAALLIDERYRISDSYFIPTESPLWQNEVFANHFLTIPDEHTLVSLPHTQDTWQTTDLIVVPLISADNTLLGLLTPDAPVDGLRPDRSMMECLELLANQAALIIEGAQLYEAAKQRSQEYATLVEIGHALFSPNTLHDLSSVYETIYKQIQRIIPFDAFIAFRYMHTTDKLTVDYIIDEGIVYPSENYDIIPVLARKLFLKEEEYFLFSTYEEYKSYDDAIENRQSGEEGYDNFIGSHRPSEAFIYVPLHFGKEVLGMLSLQSYTPYTYTTHHAELLQEIALQASIAITNAQLYTDLREAVQRAEESEQLKNHFLLTASHEIRTPLTAIQGYLELLSIHSSTLSEKNRNTFINNARRASEEVILLLGNVMDTSRMNQREIALMMHTVQLSRTIFPVLDILEPNVVRQHRNIQVSVDNSLCVHVDESRLRQVLLNVLSNAMKYTPKKTDIFIAAECRDAPVVHKHISSSTTPHEESFVVLSIRDQGNGIAPEDQERLFTKFMRLPNALKSMQRGSGLGLYLCRQLVEAMGGAIWVESTGKPGEGTTFFIALPHAAS